MGTIVLPDYVYAREEKDGQVADEYLLPFVKFVQIALHSKGQAAFINSQLKSLSVDRTIIIRPLTEEQVQESAHYRALLNQRSST